MVTLTLARRLDLGHLPPDEAAQVAARVAQIVSVWHSQGLLHRNLNPETIYLGAATEEIEIDEPSSEPVDLSRPQWDPEKSPAELSSAGPISVPRDVAEARAVFSSAQLGIDPTQIDIYQLGTLFCRLLTGEGATAYLSSLKTKSRIPAPWRSLLDRALGCSRENRLQSAAEFAAALLASQLPTQVGGDTSPAENPSSPAEKPIPFTRIGDYEIRGRIGHGGMGDVYLGFDERRNRPVAVKVLPEELARQTDFVRRFYAEAAAAARLVHPHIIEILYVGEDQGRHFFVMEYVAGESLAERLLRQTYLSIDEAVAITLQILSALRMAHEEGFVHRDIKPSNILLESAKRRAVLADFGLVKSLQEATGMTATGVVVGTVHYLSPEQARGRMIDGRSDLYSIGVLLYQMLSGELPFTGEGTTALIYQHVYEPPRPLSEVAPNISPVLGVIVDKLLAKAPADRYANAAMLIEDLNAFTAEKPLPSGADIIETDEDEDRPSDDNAPVDATVIISAPRFKQAPIVSIPEPPPEPEQPAEPRGWWDRLQQRLWTTIREQAPEFAASLQTAEEQLDSTVEDYEARQRNLQQLTKKALRLLQELRQQRHDWQAAAERAGDDEDRQRAQQNISELTQQIAEQQEQLSAMRLQQAKVSANLERLRSQRDVLQARMKVVETSLKLSGWKRRKRMAISLVGLVTSLGLLVGLWIYLDGKSAWKVAQKTMTTAGQEIPDGKTTPMPLAIPEDKFEAPQQRFKGNTGAVDAVVFSPDGQHLYGGGRNGHLVMWNVETGRVVNEYVQRASIEGISVDPVTKRVWTRGGSLSADLAGDPQEHEGFMRITLAPDARRSFVIGTGPQLKNFSLMVFNLEKRVAIESIADDVDLVKYSPAAQLLAYSKQKDPAVYLWSFQDKNKRVIERSSNAARLSALSVSPDGKKIALAESPVGDSKQVVKVWDVSTEQILFQYAIRGKRIYSMEFQPVTGMLAIASEDLVELWDLDRKRVRKMFQGSQIHSIAFSPDGKLLAGGGGTMEEPTLVLWDAAPSPVETTGDARTLPGVGPAALSRDGKRYWALQDGDLMARQLSDNVEISRVRGGFSSILRMEISPDQNYAVLSWQHGKTSQGIDQQRLQLLDLESATAKHTLDIPFVFAPFHFSMDGGQVYVVNDSTLIGWDVNSGKSEVMIRDLGPGWKMSMALSPDGNLLALGGWDQATSDSVISILDLEKSEVLHRLPLKDHYVKSIAFSADGSKLATGSRTQVVIWDVVQGTEVRRIPSSSTLWVNGLAFSPVDDLLATCGSGQTTTIWSCLSGDRIVSFVTPAAMRLESDSVSFSPDGRFLLTTSPGKAVQLLDRTALPMDRSLMKPKI